MRVWWVWNLMRSADGAVFAVYVTAETEDRARDLAKAIFARVAVEFSYGVRVADRVADWTQASTYVVVPASDVLR